MTTTRGHLARIGVVAAARERAFEAAFAVRQVEVGVASLPRSGWAIGLLGGLATVAAGVAQAYTGFSALAMLVSMPAGCVVMAWAMIVGVLLWPLAPSLVDRWARRQGHDFTSAFPRPRPLRRGNGQLSRARVPSEHGFPIGAYTGPSAGMVVRR